MARRPVGHRGWAGLGCPLAHRLLEEHVDDIVDVPAKLSARVRALGHGRKTDAASTAIAARTTATLQQINPDQPADALRLLSYRRDDLVAARTQTVNRLHAALTALVPGGAPTTLTAHRPASCCAPCVRVSSWPGPGALSHPTCWPTCGVLTGSSRRSTSSSLPA